MKEIRTIMTCLKLRRYQLLLNEDGGRPVKKTTENVNSPPRKMLNSGVFRKRASQGQKMEKMQKRIQR
jgi:hypothetical protein